MTLARYALGLAALVCVFASLGAGAVALRMWLLPQLRRAPAKLADAVLCLALLIGVLELLGTLRLFSFAPIVVGSTALGLGLRARLRPSTSEKRGGPKHRRSRRPPDAFGLGVPVLAAGLVLAEWAQLSVHSYQKGILGFDSVWYHMPLAGSFAQTGQITAIRFTNVEYLTGFYPATVELLHALGIVLMGNDVLSPAINLAWLALVLLAAWCVGHSRDVGRATLTAAALAMAAPMMLFSSAGSADNDVVGVFFLLAAVALWVNGDVNASRAGLAVVGIAAGLAISVKLTLLAPVIALTAAVIAQAPRGNRRRIGGLWAAAVGGAGGFWYVRNLIAVGNPVPWFSLGFLPTPHPPLQQQTNFSVADYLTYPRIVKDVFAPALAGGLGPWWVVILLIAVLGPLLCLMFGRDRLLRLVAIVALASLAGYLVTPGTASGLFGHPSGFRLNLRYCAPALTLALTVTPLAPPLAGRRIRWITLGALAAVFTATIAQQRLWPQAYVGTGSLIAAALLLAGTVVAFRPWSIVGSLGARSRIAAVAAIAILPLAGGAAGYAEQRHYIRDRYTFEPGLPSLSELWQWARTVRHARIAIVGTFGGFFAYPLFGIDDSNDVQYVAHHGPHGSFTPITNCREWRRAINAGHYRYVVTTASRSVWTHALGSSPEGDWTKHEPAVRSVLPQNAHAPIAVYELTGRLDPDRCSDTDQPKTAQLSL
jgi:hypothetical protein